MTQSSVSLDAVQLQDTTLVIAGRLQKIKKEELYELLEDQFDAYVAGTLSRSTNYLVVGKGGDAKVEKAKKLDVDILSEADILKLLNHET